MRQSSPDATETLEREMPDRGAAQQPSPPPAPREELVEADLLVEDVSIDGMCGVY